MRRRLQFKQPRRDLVCTRRRIGLGMGGVEVLLMVAAALVGLGGELEEEDEDSWEVWRGLPVVSKFV